MSHFVARFDGYDMIPEHMRGAIQRYVDQGIPPGHFLSSVIKNDLRGAVERADDDNIRIIHHYVRWFYNRAPSGCWGSPENYQYWIKNGGYRGTEGRVLAEARSKDDNQDHG